MDQLRALNASGELRAQPEHGWRGFRVRGVPTPGLAASIRRYSFGGNASERLQVFAPGKGSQCRLLRSNKAAGAAAHVAIAHALRKGQAPRCTSYTSTCAHAAVTFCRRAGLVYEADELVIAHPTLKLATRFDAVCLSTALPGGYELLSWKTGCGPRTAAEIMHHKAQLAMEARMLEAGHGVPVSRATLLYVGAIQHMHTGAMAPVFQGYDLSDAERERLADEIEAKLAKKRTKKAGKAKTGRKGKTATRPSNEGTTKKKRSRKSKK